MRTSLACLFLLTLLTFDSKGQYALDGFDLEDSTTHWFDGQLGLQSLEIFTGVYVSLQGRPAIDQASWGASIWEVGDIYYRGAHFREMYLFYDLENDHLLTKNHTNSAYLDQPIKLNQDQVDWFQIGEDRFVYQTISSMPAGFYQELHAQDGFGMYARRRKVPKVEVQDVRLISDDSFYVIIGEEVHRVGKPSSFYKLFPEQKAQLKTVFKSIGVRKFENASSPQLKQLARRCAAVIMRS